MKGDVELPAHLGFFGTVGNMFGASWLAALVQQGRSAWAGRLGFLHR